MTNVDEIAEEEHLNLPWSMSGQTGYVLDCNGAPVIDTFGYLNAYHKGIALAQFLVFLANKHYREQRYRGHSEPGSDIDPELLITEIAEPPPVIAPAGLIANNVDVKVQYGP